MQNLANCLYERSSVRWAYSISVGGDLSSPVGVHLADRGVQHPDRGQPSSPRRALFSQHQLWIRWGTFELDSLLPSLFVKIFLH
jgi:hypothetical protein